MERKGLFFGEGKWWDWVGFAQKWGVQVWGCEKRLSGFKPSQRLGPGQPLAHTPPPPWLVGEGEEGEKTSWVELTSV